MPTTLTCGKFHCQPPCAYPYSIPDTFTLNLVIGAMCPRTYVYNWEVTHFTPGLYANFIGCSNQYTYVQIPAACGGGTSSLSLTMQRTSIPSNRSTSDLVGLWTNTTNDYYGGSAAGLGLTSGYQGTPLDSQGYAGFGNPLNGCQVPNFLWSPPQSGPFSSAYNLVSDVTTAGLGGYVEFGAELGISLAFYFRNNCSAVIEAYFLDTQTSGVTQCSSSGGPIIYPAWGSAITIPTFILGEDFSIFNGENRNLDAVLAGTMPNNLNGQITVEVATEVGPYSIYGSQTGVVSSQPPPIYMQECGCTQLAREYTLTVSGDCSYLNGTYTIKYGVTGDGQPNRWSVILDDGRAFYFGESLIQYSGEVLALNTPIGWANLDSVSCDPFVASGHMSYALLSGDCSCTKQVPFIPCNQSNGCPNTTQTGTLYWTVS